METINFVIGIFRIYLILFGLLSLGFAGLGLAFGGLMLSLFGFGSAIIFFWMQNMLKQRKAFSRIFVLIVHSLVIIYFKALMTNLPNLTNRLISEGVHVYGVFIFIPITLIFVISLFPYWFFTRPTVRGQFKKN